MKEERRQALLELYGIGVAKCLYGKNKGMWFGTYVLFEVDYETDDFKTRREAEDQAIADYESISETGEK